MYIKKCEHVQLNFITNNLFQTFFIYIVLKLMYVRLRLCIENNENSNLQTIF